MGLPLVTVLLQSAVASAWWSAAAFANADCGYFCERGLLENRFYEGCDDNGNRGWPDEAEYLRCKKLLFAFPEALRT
jgi:hypothetical protein